jgi:hypothetical protein
MAISRRLIAVAVSAAAAGVVLYVSSKLREGQQRKSAVDDANAEKDRAAEHKRKADEERAKAHSAEAADAGGQTENAAGAPAPPATAPAAHATPGSGAQKELALFLAGDAWHDEIGWQALWEKEGVAAADEWLRTRGREVLVGERKKLVDHPALLAGCRRRWIVVCRYAGIDVGDAAILWNQTETA